MDVPTHNTIGMAIFRELTERENRSGALWEKSFGKEALSKPLDPKAMVNLSSFDKAFSMPVPLDVQLQMMKESNKKLDKEVAHFEASSFPFKSKTPVSEASIGLYGEKAWHTQPKQDGAPAAVRPQLPDPRFKQRQWQVERGTYEYVSLEPHHINGRLKALGEKP